MRLRWAALAVPPLLLCAVVACTGDDGDGVATVEGGAPAETSPTPTADDVLAQELEFIDCMREQGQEMVDPIPGDTSGRSALIYEIDVNGKGSDPAFQAAIDACAEFLPEPPPAEPPTEDDLSSLRAFAQCMRENGVPDYPDPDADGESSGYWLEEGNPVHDAAIEACEQLLPPDGE